MFSSWDASTCSTPLYTFVALFSLLLFLFYTLVETKISDSLRENALVSPLVTKTILTLFACGGSFFFFTSLSTVEPRYLSTKVTCWLLDQLERPTKKERRKERKGTLPLMGGMSWICSLGRSIPRGKSFTCCLHHCFLFLFFLLLASLSLCRTVALALRGR